MANALATPKMFDLRTPDACAIAGTMNKDDGMVHHVSAYGFP